MTYTPVYMFSPPSPPLAACEYVLAMADDCEGGGYVPWMAIERCSSSSGVRLVVIASAVLFLLYLFLLLSVAADDFFCANIATVVDHHQISQNIAVGCWIGSSGMSYNKMSPGHNTDGFR